MTYTHLGDFSVEPTRSVLLRCERCAVEWRGCAAANECPKCGRTLDHWEDMNKDNDESEALDIASKSLLQMTKAMTSDLEEIANNISAEGLRPSEYIQVALRYLCAFLMHSGGASDGEVRDMLTTHLRAAIKGAREVVSEVEKDS